MHESFRVVEVNFQIIAQLKVVGLGQEWVESMQASTRDVFQSESIFERFSLFFLFLLLNELLLMRDIFLIEIDPGYVLLEEGNEIIILGLWEEWARQ
jgi:hypothetical protein